MGKKNIVTIILAISITVGAGLIAIDPLTAGAQQSPAAVSALDFDQLEQMIVAIQKQLAQIVAILQSRANSTTGAATGATAGWKTYQDDKQGFQLQYPAGTAISKNNISLTGVGDANSTEVIFDFPDKVANFDFEIPRIIVGIETQNNATYTNEPFDCDINGRFQPTDFTVNGITFAKSNASADYSGVETAATAADYCVIRNGIRYVVRQLVGPYDKYKYEGQKIVYGGPDHDLTFQHFDQLMQLLNFQFASQPVCGNGSCETGETIFSCPQDCPQLVKDIIELTPVDADVLSCTDAKGQEHSVTGPDNYGASDYARWFIWNSCAAKKTFLPQMTASPQPVILYVYGDNCPTCQCQYPVFDVYEQAGGWTKVASVDLSKDRIVSSDGLVANVHAYSFTPNSNTFQIVAHSCFYMKVYQGDWSSTEKNFSSWEALPVNANRFDMR